MNGSVHLNLSLSPPGGLSTFSSSVCNAVLYLCLAVALCNFSRLPVMIVLTATFRGVQDSEKFVTWSKCHWFYFCCLNQILSKTPQALGRPYQQHLVMSWSIRPFPVVCVSLNTLIFQTLVLSNIQQINASINTALSTVCTALKWRVSSHVSALKKTMICVNDMHLLWSDLQ